jgi:hypothetical protein
VIFILCCLFARARALSQGLTKILTQKLYRCSLAIQCPEFHSSDAERDTCEMVAGFFIDDQKSESAAILVIRFVTVKLFERDSIVKKKEREAYR